MKKPKRKTKINDFKLAKLELKKGDLVVLKCHGVVSLEMAEQFKKHFEAILPEGVKTIVLDKDLDIGKIEWMG